MKQLLLALLLSLSFAAYAEDEVEAEAFDDYEGLQTITAVPVEEPEVLTGTASWYGPGFHGRRTADGTRYNQNGISAASNRWPLGTWVRVTHLESGLAVVLKITDRMAVNNPRLIDLSVGAARALKMVQQGIAEVAIQVLDSNEQVFLTSANR